MNKNTWHISKYGGQNLACWCLHLWLLWTAFTCCCPLSWNGGSMFHPLLHIYAKTPFCCVETAANHTLNHWYVVVFGRLWANMHPLWTQLSHWQMFIQNGEYTAFWYLQLLCYLMQLQFMIGQNEFVEFFGVFQDNCRILVTWASSIIGVCTTVFKVSIPLLNNFFWWSRVWIILIKPLLCLNSIFSHQKTMLYQHTKFRFFHCFENLQQ